MRTHFIHRHAGEEPMPTKIPTAEALTMLREAQECYRNKLSEIEAEIAILEGEI